jgi:hypothetical protein
MWGRVICFENKVEGHRLKILARRSQQISPVPLLSARASTGKGGAGLLGGCRGSLETAPTSSRLELMGGWLC